MSLQKLFFHFAVALAAFGLSLGLLEIGSFFKAALAPVRFVFEVPPPLTAPVIFPAQPGGYGEGSEDSPAFRPEEKPEPESVDYGETGYYPIISKTPRAFKDFELLTLDTTEYDETSKKVVRIKPRGSLLMKTEFEFSWLHIENKRISFVTRTQKGLSYQFDGKFIENGEELIGKDKYGGEYTETVVLEGRLTKWRNGKKIAEAKVKFGFYVGC